MQESSEAALQYHVPSANRNAEKNAHTCDPFSQQDNDEDDDDELIEIMCFKVLQSDDPARGT